VDAGDRVKQGQLLAVLEIPEMKDDEARAEAGVDRVQAEVARAKDELTRTESTHQMTHLSADRLAEVMKQRPGLVAQQEVDDARSKDLVSEAQVAAARSALNAVEQQVRVNRAELQKVRTLYEYARVTAPFEGVITKRYADTGSMIQAGTASNAMPLVKLSQNNRLRLILPVPESAVPSVRVGQSVSVHVPTLNRSFPGRVARFAERVQSTTRTMDTEVDVENPNLVLVPGMFAEVNLELSHHKDALAVPLTAVDPDPAEGWGKVMVVNGDNRAEVQRVRLGLQTSTHAEVLSGLNQGDLVVVGSRASLHAGQPLRPKRTTDEAARAEGR
jgi:RND family efflux transporter MFP subunit